MTDEKKEIKQPSVKNLSSEQKVEFLQKGAKLPEKIEFAKEEIITKEALKREMDTMELNDDLKKEVEQKSKRIQILGEEGKIEHLLEIAKDKGVVFSIKVAEHMNDPYILDTFHDILVKNWVDYKKFLK